MIGRKVYPPTFHLPAVDTLPDEKWEGRLCVHSSNNIYNQSLVASMIESHGEEVTDEWAVGLVQNFARDPQGGDTDQIRAVAAGLSAVTIANVYYLARLVRSDDSQAQQAATAVSVNFPPAAYDGAHVNIRGAEIAAT